MSDLDILKQFNKYKKQIFEEIIEEFGEQNRNIILQRLAEFVLIFDSNPDENYKYMLDNINYFKFIDIITIKEQYQKYKRIKNRAKQELQIELLVIISQIFKIDIEKIANNSEIILNLFANENLDSSYIDSYSKKSLEILNNDFPKTIKENIIKEQKKLEEELKKINISIDYKHVDYFINKRLLLQDKIYEKILKSNSDYTKKLENCINSKDYLDLYYISFFKTSNTGITKNGVKYIFVPVIYLKNNEYKSIDVEIIHELLHGLAKEKVSNIINEVNVERHAQNIVKKLHKKNIFIFDDQNDCEIEGECYYECLFPITERLFIDYDEAFKYCLLEGNYDEFKNIFGDLFSLYSNKLKEVYNLIVANIESGNYDIIEKDLFSELYKILEEMYDFSKQNRRGKNV